MAHKGEFAIYLPHGNVVWRAFPYELHMSYRMGSYGMTYDAHVGS